MMRRIRLFLFLAVGALAVTTMAQPPSAPAGDATPTGLPRYSHQRLREQGIDAQPFSPTLGHLFASGRVVVIPPDRAAPPPDYIDAGPCIFSAVDRYGRLYHFDEGLRWWMDPAPALPAPLPDTGWSVVWNALQQRVELTVSAPYEQSAGLNPRVRMFHWYPTGWAAIERENPPPAGEGHLLHFHPLAGKWFMMGADPDRGGRPAAWVGDEEGWRAWDDTEPLQLTTVDYSADPVLRAPNLAAETAVAPVEDDDIPVKNADPAKRVLRPELVEALREETESIPSVAAEEDSPTTPTAAANSQPAATRTLRPDYASLRALTGGPAAGLAAVGSDGTVWRWAGGEWTRVGAVPPERLWLAEYLPAHDQMLFVWQYGRGRDRILLSGLRPAEWIEHTGPWPLNQTGIVSVNQESTGEWGGWVRMAGEDRLTSAGAENLEQSPVGSGKLAVRLSGEYGNAVIAHEDLEIVELPPELRRISPGAAAYVPALGGLVVPSLAGAGLYASHQPFLPEGWAEAWEATPKTAETLAADLAGSPTLLDARIEAERSHRLDVIESTWSFWVFRGDLIRWLAAPYTLNPMIGSMHGRHTAGRYEALDWAQPAPGVLHYQYRQESADNMQWLDSPQLDLSRIEPLRETRRGRLELTNPVVWGHPADVVLAGWQLDNSTPTLIREWPSGLRDYSYAAPPDSGHLLMMDATQPESIRIEPLPAPYGQGAQLFVDPNRHKMFLFLARTATPARQSGENRVTFAGRSRIWEWDGEIWSELEAGGVDSGSAAGEVAYDTVAGRFLRLTPEGLYEWAPGQDWRRLWVGGAGSFGGNPPTGTQLRIHPQSGEIAGVWTLDLPLVRQWRNNAWRPDRGGLGLVGESGLLHVRIATGMVNVKDQDLREESARLELFASRRPHEFIAVDGPWLRAVRLDWNRNRDRDWKYGAMSIRFSVAGER